MSDGGIKDFLFYWGKSDEGQIGVKIDSEPQYVRPALSLSPLPFVVKKISCGAKHTVALTEDGYVYTSGANDFCQLGRTGSQRSFGRITSLETRHMIDVSCGSHHTLVLDKNGEVFGFGCNSFGQLASDPAETCFCSPRRVCLGITNIKYVSCAYDTSFAISQTGEILSWGCNKYCQLGYKTEGVFSYVPSEIETLRGIPVSIIRGGGSYSVAISSNGVVYSWGNNSNYQTGHLMTGEVMEVPSVVSQIIGISIVYVSCGRDHTAMLSEDGRVLTFGSGRYGQLGHGQDNNEPSPRQVMDLGGSFTRFIECGWNHTVAFVPDNNCVYAFGNSVSGQCGLVEGKNAINLPNGIKVPSYAEDLKLCVKQVAVGGDYCLVVLTSDKSYAELQNNFPQLQGHAIKYGKSGCDVSHSDVMSCGLHSNTYDKLGKRLSIIFSSIGCLNSSFLRRDQPILTARRQNIDFKIVHELSEKISVCLELQNSILPSIEALSTSLSKYCPPHFEGYRFIYILLFLPICLIRKNSDPFVNLMENLFSWGSCYSAIQIFAILPPSCFSNTLKDLKKHFRDYIQPFDAFGNEYRKQHGTEDVVKRFCMGLDTFYLLNKQYKLVHYSSFYIMGIEKIFPVYDEFVEKQRNPGKESIIDYPYLFESAIKARFIYLSTMLSTIEGSRLWPLGISSRGINNLIDSFYQLPYSEFFHLMVRRDHLVEDALNSLAFCPKNELRRLIRVRFVGEEAQDQGGVRKEFFFLLIREIFNPENGMFTCNQQSNLVWFPEYEIYEETTYYFVGLIISLAIFNFIILDLHFPTALYKKLLGVSVGIEDLLSLDSVLGRSLQHILDYNDEDFEEVFDLTFEITRSEFGTLKKVDLISNGANVKVTQENKQTYVDLYIDYIFNKCCLKYYSAFESGFYSVNTFFFKKLFNPYELEEIVIGCQDYDFNILKKITTYSGEYSGTHPTIQRFWDVVFGFPIELKKKFLFFLTGSDRVPLQGMSAMTLTIQPCNMSDDHLPVAHTCFNLLDLPSYNSQEVLEDKLKKAIENCEGFGLI